LSGDLAKFIRLKAASSQHLVYATWLKKNKQTPTQINPNKDSEVQATWEKEICRNIYTAMTRKKGEHKNIRSWANKQQENAQNV